MRSLFIALSWRVGIGLVIAAIGILVSFVFHNWKIDNWFAILGFVFIGLAVIPLTPGPRALSMFANMRTKGAEYTDSNRRDMVSTLNYAMTLVLIGIINIIVPMLVTHFIA